MNQIEVQSIQPAEAEPWLLRKHYARRLCPVSFAISGTVEHLGSFVQGPFVWHVYE